MLNLEMQAAQHALAAFALVILHKAGGQAGVGKFAFAVRFHKIAAVVAKNGRLYDGQPFDAGFDEFEFSHIAYFP